MDLLSIWHDYRYCSKILFSTLSALGQGHTDLEILCQSVTSKFLISLIYSATFQIILFIFGIQIAALDDVHPKLYPVPCLPLPLCRTHTMIKILRS